MMTARQVGWLTASLMAMALAGCATTHGGLGTSAERLDRNAQAFAQDSEEAPRGYAENTSYTEDARDFAARAHEFRRAVEDEDRDADDRDVKDAFAELSRSYHALRDDVERSDDREARRDLHPITQAYLDVEDEMGGARAPSRYSDSDDDPSGSH